MEATKLDFRAFMEAIQHCRLDCSLDKKIQLESRNSKMKTWNALFYFSNEKRCWHIRSVSYPRYERKRVTRELSNNAIVCWKFSLLISFQHIYRLNHQVLCRKIAPLQNRKIGSKTTKEKIFKLWKIQNRPPEFCNFVFLWGLFCCKENCGINGVIFWNIFSHILKSSSTRSNF